MTSEPLTPADIAAIRARLDAYDRECQQFSFERRLEYVRAQMPLLDNAPEDLRRLLDRVAALEAALGELVEAALRVTKQTDLRMETPLTAAIFALGETVVDCRMILRKAKATTDDE